MNQFFRRLPLLSKLILIGLIPCGFLVYLTAQVYNEKTEKLRLFDNYKAYMTESANINALINALQDERKFSFDYAMTKTMRKELVLQRPRTDAYIQRLQKSNDPSLLGFTNYTRLKELPEMRRKIDYLGGKPDEVLHFYSNTVFRLNTLNTIPPATTPYLQPLYKDLMAQKILSEMVTYLGIIRSNIYNLLHTRQHIALTLVGTVGAHDVYNSYETELLAKATPRILERYQNIRTATALKPTVDYIDTAFVRFSLDSIYSAPAWWQVSNDGVNELRALQNDIWNGLNHRLEQLYQAEKQARTITLVLLILAVVLVVAVISYIVFIISQTLRELRIAAERISNGETGVLIKAASNDAIGSLAKSISRIDHNNKVLAEATAAIGKGNYSVEVLPRGDADILANAILATRNELEQYSQRMELLVKERTIELARSNEDLQQFAHVASHDLKEPLRKIATFSNILSEEQTDVLSEKGKLYLQKIEKASNRMSQMIEGILTYSTVSVNEQEFQNIDLNEVMRDVENDLELAILQKEAAIHYKPLPKVRGIKLLLHQLFYNLMNNALKFSSSDVAPVITVSTQVPTKETIGNSLFNLKPGKYVQVDIRDNGIGFNCDSAERIFGVFSRLNAKDRYEGTGLGLALCKKIVHRHGGAIWADGEENKGACFHILLPVS